MTTTEEQNLHQRIAEMSTRITRLENEHGEALNLLQDQIAHTDVLVAAIRQRLAGVRIALS